MDSELPGGFFYRVGFDIALKKLLCLSVNEDLRTEPISFPSLEKRKNCSDSVQESNSIEKTRRTVLGPGTP
jgi:hypothetical protein